MALQQMERIATQADSIMPLLAAGVARCAAVGDAQWTPGEGVPC